MTEQIAIKVGGTSNSTAETVGRCMELSGNSRVLVTSAPGGLSPEQLEAFPVHADIDPEFLAKRVTRQWMDAYEEYRATQDVPRYMTDSITARNAEIVNGHGITSLQGEWLGSIRARVLATVQVGEEAAFMAGELMQAEIYAAMGRRLLDPGRARFPLPANNSPEAAAAWRTWANEAVDVNHPNVQPGNVWFDGNSLRIFGQGGSDTSGAKMSVATGAEEYWNVTDTSAQSVSPRLIVDSSRRRMIEHLTYKEGRELGRAGTGLLHPEAIVPLRGTGIPTHIINLFDSTGLYTRYTDEIEDPERTGRVMAISLIPELSVFAVDEPGMSEESGRLNAFTASLKEADVNLVDIESNGSDSDLFLVHGEDKEEARGALEDAVENNGGITAEDCAMVTLVGYSLRSRELAIRNELAAAGLTDNGNAYWFKGDHSLRFTVPRNRAAMIVDRAHALLIETQSQL
jgi:aspartokinase